jgi:hypothetical protein
MNGAVANTPVENFVTPTSFPSTTYTTTSSQ